MGKRPPHLAPYPRRYDEPGWHIYWVAISPERIIKYKVHNNEFRGFSRFADEQDLKTSRDVHLNPDGHIPTHARLYM